MSESFGQHARGANCDAYRHDALQRDKPAREHKETSAEEALILITCACAGAEQIQGFMRRVKIRPGRRATVTDAILPHYRTRSGYDLSRFAADCSAPAPFVEMAA